jgi:hypothetical protein
MALAIGRNMPNLTGSLILSRCPHCSIASPHLNRVHYFETNNHEGTHLRRWAIYVCGTCGGVVSACAANQGQPVTDYFPSSTMVDKEIPDRPREYLQQAQESLHAPSGAVMLCASAVDAMLKIKGYTDGSLYSRIEKAVEDNLITSDMATWAHEVRLDANDQRHADQAASLPTRQDALRVIEFTSALAEFLFVLPGRIQRGLNVNG